MTLDWMSVYCRAKKRSRWRMPLYKASDRYAIEPGSLYQTLTQSLALLTHSVTFSVCYKY
ncbi:hypothetical protein [Coleofasciculus sp. H7-2]|uniref:hypothetical protein n=1 Tax=Coleofasciculus sp. H7-2 TaxID=3351545 RepID=UPI00366F0ECE